MDSRVEKASAPLGMEPGVYIDRWQDCLLVLMVDPKHDLTIISHGLDAKVINNLVNNLPHTYHQWQSGDPTITRLSLADFHNSQDPDLIDLRTRLATQETQDDEVAAPVKISVQALPDRLPTTVGRVA